MVTTYGKKKIMTCSLMIEHLCHTITIIVTDRVLVLTDQSEHGGKWVRLLTVTLKVKYFYCHIVKLFTFEIRSLSSKSTMSSTEQHPGETDSVAM